MNQYGLGYRIYDLLSEIKIELKKIQINLKNKQTKINQMDLTRVIDSAVQGWFLKYAQILQF